MDAAFVDRSHLPRLSPVVWRVLTGLLALGLGLLSGRPALAINPLCSLFNYCRYEGVAFTIKVVDQETGQPLADVHALAEWVQHGMYGRGGPVMVQDAVSGPDGVLIFPAWGPVRGSSGGLLSSEAPVITLFKPGYLLVVPQGHARVITNEFPRGTTDATLVRRFGQDGQTIAMAQFRGTVDEWVWDLHEATSASGGISKDRLLRFRIPYLNRLRRLWAERDHLPKKYQEPGQILWNIQREIAFLEEGKQ